MYQSLHLAHSMHLKEEYSSVNTLLKVSKFEVYAWHVIGDFKVVAFLMGPRVIFAFVTAGTPWHSDRV